MTRWRNAVAVLTCLVLARSAGAEAVKKPGARTDPPGVPVEAVLKANKDTYQLDLGGKTPDEIRKDLAANRYPAAPTVDLVLELRNTGKEDLKIRVGGTPSIIDLDLRGPGAVSVPLRGRITSKIYILPKDVTLAAGKSVTVKITTLAFGFKGAYRAYWLEAGKYTLAASYKTSVSPAPRGARDAGKGFGAVTLTSAPIPLKVEAK